MLDSFYGWLVKHLPKRFVLRCAYYAINLVTTKFDRLRNMSIIDLLKRLDSFE